MNLIKQEISKQTLRAINNAINENEILLHKTPEIIIGKTTRRSFGDYTSSVSFQIANQTKVKPETIARAIVRNFPKTEQLEKINQLNGHINFFLSKSWLQKQVDIILQESKKHTQINLNRGHRILIECVSANPTGPLTVGRTRGGVIGDALYRIFSVLGHDVEMEYYFNNAGKQMRNLGLSVQARYQEKLGLSYSFPEGGYLGDYINALAHEIIEIHGKDCASKKGQFFRDFAETRIFEEIRNSLKRIRINFDNYFNETTLYENNAVWSVLERLEEKGLIYRSRLPEGESPDNKQKIYSKRESDPEMPATWVRMRFLRDGASDCVLVKASGEPTYRLPDTAYHINKIERGYDRIITILGADHKEEEKDVKAMLKALGYRVDHLSSLINQFVTLVEDGQSKKMSTRQGEFVTIDDLADSIGEDAVRYFLLSKSPGSHINFDLELAQEQSSNNPVYYIQNAHVRCASIARVAREQEISYAGGRVELLTGPQELRLMQKLIELPEILIDCAKDLSPHKLAVWAHTELAKTFHQTYEEVRAITQGQLSEETMARLKLYAAAQEIFRRVLNLMGMEAPERM